MKKYFWLIVILIVATALRFYHNLDISLWHDEAFSALMIRYPWQEMFYRLGLDVHPPAYYVALRLWHYGFGDSLLSLRGFSILFGVLGVWATWLFVKLTFKSEKAALWAAFLTAVNPFTITFSTEARMYTFGAFFALLAAYFLVRALREQKEFYSDEKLNMPNLPQDIKLKKNFVWHYVWFALCAGVIDMTHYYLFFTTVALCLYALIYHLYHYKYNFKRYAALLSSYIAIIILFLPWLKQLLFQYKQVQAGYWIPPIDVWSIPGTLWTILLAIGHNNSNSVTQKMLIVVVLFSVFFFWRFLRKSDFYEKWLVVLAFLAPFGGAILFAVLAHLKGSNTSVYQERYFLFSSTFYIIALAVWLEEIKPKWLSVSLFLIYAVFNFYAFSNYWSGLDIAHKPGMNAAAKFLGANVTASDHVFVGTSFEFFNYKYYDFSAYPLPTGVRPLLFSGGTTQAKDIPHFAGTALLSDADLLPSFSGAAHPGDTVWLLWTYAFGASKPDVPLSWIKVDEHEYPDVRPYVGTSIYVTEYRVN